MKKKLTAIALVVAMLAIAVIGGSLAYFTDTTEAKQNVFTVGGVDIDLDEPSWEGEANLMPGVVFAKDPTITVDENSEDCYVFLQMDMNKYVSLINLMGVDAYKNNIGGLAGAYPGFTAFVATLTTDNAIRAAVVNRWFGGIDHSKWKVMNTEEISDLVDNVARGTNANKLSVILGYIGDDDILSAGDSVTFMESFGIPSTVKQSMFDGEDAYYIGDVSKSNFNTDASTFKMTFTAYAIQAEGIDDGIDGAYAALFEN